MSLNKDTRTSIVHENSAPTTQKPTSRQSDSPLLDQVVRELEANRLKLEREEILDTEIPERRVYDINYKKSPLSLCHTCPFFDRDCSTIPMSLFKDRDQKLYVITCRDFKRKAKRETGGIVPIQTEPDNVPVVMMTPGETLVRTSDAETLKEAIRTNTYPRVIHPYDEERVKRIALPDSLDRE